MHDISIKYFVVYLMGATNRFHDSSAIVYIGIISQLTGVAMPSFARRNASIQRIGCDLGALTKRRSADSIGFRHRELNKLVGYGCFSGSNLRFQQTVHIQIPFSMFPHFYHR